MLQEDARGAGRSALRAPIAAASESRRVVSGRTTPEPADSDGRREPHVLGVRA